MQACVVLVRFGANCANVLRLGFCGLPRDREDFLLCAFEDLCSGEFFIACKLRDRLFPAEPMRLWTALSRMTSAYSGAFAVVGTRVESSARYADPPAAWRAPCPLSFSVTVSRSIGVRSSERSTMALKIAPCTGSWKSSTRSFAIDVDHQIAVYEHGAKRCLLCFDAVGRKIRKHYRKMPGRNMKRFGDGALRQRTPCDRRRSEESVRIKGRRVLLLTERSFYEWVKGRES